MNNYENLTREELEVRLSKLESNYSKTKDRAAKYMQDNQEYRLLHSCKGNAKRSGLDFNLSVEDIVIPEFCMYLGCRITNTPNQGRVWSNASIDRIDSTKGYIKGNIQVISDLANKMKSNATKDQLITFAKGILNIYGRATNNQTIASGGELPQA